MTIKCSGINSDTFQDHPILKNHSNLLDSIRNTFQDEDDIWIIKVPGRVNLIGEHVDYNNGPVLPCAIDREVVLCCRKNDTGTVHVSNVNSVYSNITFSLLDQIIPDKKGSWGNYIKAGVKGITDYAFQSTSSNKASLAGFDAVISSTVPQAAGLSSSSALVVAAALATLTANEIALDKLTLAEICADAEHFVGTSGGGMDHAAILFGEKDTFIRLRFNPLKADPISAPPEIELVLFHSLIEAEKSRNAREAYNKRVLECHMAIDGFNQFLKNQHIILENVLKYIGDVTPDFIGMSQSEIDRLVLEFLDSLSDKYSLKELESFIQTPSNELATRYKHILQDTSLDDIKDGFNLKGRFKHVYSECRRVDQAIQSLGINDIARLGKILDASHQSLSRDYEVSTSEIDSLVNLLKKNGTYGARLIGAGFGGMILGLTDSSHSDELIKNIQESFYSRHSVKHIKETVIRCNTAGGAGVVEI
jgi:N-acetylgalactosamine kinase